MFLLPSYVNILSTYLIYLMILKFLSFLTVMYAMCNLHDVSWGTKGDNGASKDLGGAKKVANKDGQDMYEVELPTVSDHSIFWKYV